MTSPLPPLEAEPLYDGIKVHDKSVCEPPCPFHAPSDHPLKNAKIHIRVDKDCLVERICEHGVGHDDPDSVAYMQRHGVDWAGVHGCDGCCAKAAPLEAEVEPILDALTAYYANNGQFGINIAEAKQKLLALLTKARVEARYDEQIRTKTSSLDRSHIVVHFPQRVITQRKRLADLRASLRADQTKQDTPMQNKQKQSELVLWCDFHGLTCTACPRSERITVDALKTKTYAGSQYGKLPYTPYENYMQGRLKTEGDKNA